MKDENIFINALSQELNRIRRLLSILPEPNEKYKVGSIVKRVNSNGTTYYHKTSTGSGDRRKTTTTKLGGQDSKAVEDLLKARYGEALRNILTLNEATIEKVMASYHNYSHEAITSMLPKSCQELLLSSEEFAVLQHKSNRWTNIDYEKNPMPISSGHRTITGEIVRSKGEAIIYNHLVYLGIPFRYECALRLNLDGVERTVYPDFTILCNNGEQIYIEYSGMINQSNYLGRMVEKLRMMYINDIVINRNLFLFMDDAEGCLDMRMVNDILSKIIAPMVWGN